MPTARVFKSSNSQAVRLPKEFRFNDLWIAAHAWAADLILVTHNECEFARIDGLRIENWVAKETRE